MRGDYWINLQMLGAGGSVDIDGKRIAGSGAVKGTMHGDTVLLSKDGLLPTTDGLDNPWGAIQLGAGAQRIDVSIDPDTSNVPAQVQYRR